ncbi:hypothetical protein BH688_07630 [Kushneria phosphatilytica]|uniref:Winged helix-turn-helix transcriptional regulator n=3 Tax=Kushneria phosphatilytica TaxID=657387 RepID=A0A1S1NW10_9GAMM|nr:hypothetical protein BH688_07630 [Kushneria phosphatilytica]QEL12245.1 winged helix-turn-helix transcriptional regulator [Kushneria phosphatilytica]
MCSVSAVRPLTPDASNDGHDRAAEVMKACGSSVRLRMLKIIASEDEIMVSELNKRIDLTQSALSQHLKVLRDADLVQTRRDSQRIYYSIKGDEVLTLLRSLKSLFG